MLCPQYFVGKSALLVSIVPHTVGDDEQVKSLPRKSKQYLIKVQVHPDKDDTEFRSVLWHFGNPPPPVNTPVTVLCNLPDIKHEVSYLLCLRLNLEY